MHTRAAMMAKSSAPICRVEMRVAIRAEMKKPEVMIIMTRASHILYPSFGRSGVGNPAKLTLAMVPFALLTIARVGIVWMK